MATQPDSAGWIEWKGGECPLPHRVKVEVHYRGYGLDHSEIAEAGSLAYGLYDCWMHQPHPTDGSHDGDIIAYRVAQS